MDPVPELNSETTRLDFLQDQGDPPYYGQGYGYRKQVPDSETGERDFSSCPCVLVRRGQTASLAIDAERVTQDAASSGVALSDPLSLADLPQKEILDVLCNHSLSH